MYGLVLEGGGSRGAFHIGAYKALQDLNIEVDLVVGTSIGAMNAAMICQDKVDEAYEMWENIKPSMILSLEEDELKTVINKKINIEGMKIYGKMLHKMIGEKGLDSSAMEDLVNYHIDEELLRKSTKQYGLVTVSLTDREPVELYIDEIPLGKLNDFILASANYPLFKRKKVENKNYIDGGLANNLPINMAIKKGFENIIVIRTKENNILRGLKRIKENNLNIMYIYPSENLGGSLDFDKERANRNLKLGYFDTMRVFKDLNGQSYYIRVDQQETDFFDMLNLIDKDMVIKMRDLFGLPQIDSYKRLLFEFIIPKIAKIVSLEEDYTYKNFVIGILEVVAEYLKIERLNIYSSKEFYDIIYEKYSFENKLLENETYFEKILQLDLLNLKNKNKIIISVFEIIKDVISFD